jgi:kynurenine 3-monooxygenase
MNTEPITVSGGGLVGSLVALILARRGYRVTLLERWLDFRADKSAAPKSINLVLTSRGLRAIEQMGGGLKDEMLELAVPVTGRIMHQTNGTEVFQPYGKDDSEHNHSISRLGLNQFLLDKAEQAGVKVHFEIEVKDYDLERNVLICDKGVPDKFSGRKGVCTTPERIEIPVQGRLIACDGQTSQIRRSLQQRGHLTSSAEFLPAGYMEMTFPKRESAGVLARHGLHIWPRGTHFIMALSNLDGSFTGTLYMAKDGRESFATLKAGGDAAVRRFFEANYGDAIPLMGGLGKICEEFTANPVGRLGTVRTDKWHVGGKVLIMGDASHGIVPFFGQGTNSGFEDCYILSTLLDEAGCCGLGATSAGVDAARLERQYAQIFGVFELRRKLNADAIATMALDNYVEMMARVGDDTFLLKKAIENRIEKAMPLKYRR